MSTLTINISEAVEKRLRDEAQRRELTIEELVQELMITAIPARRQSIEDAIKGTFQDNDEVYRRLAK